MSVEHTSFILTLIPRAVFGLFDLRWAGMPLEGLLGRSAGALGGLWGLDIGALGGLWGLVIRALGGLFGLPCDLIGGPLGGRLGLGGPRSLVTEALIGRLDLGPASASTLSVLLMSSWSLCSGVC